MKNLNLLVAGVGGQGTLLASDILAEVGMQAGYDAKKSDVLGLAIRGGSVLSHVRWGDHVASPVVRRGRMDFMLAFEPLEAMRGIRLMNPNGIIVCNTQPVVPISVSSGDGRYHARSDIEKALSTAAQVVHYVDATKEAVRAGSAKTTNVIMLGAFSALVDISVDIWEDVVLSRVPAKFVDLNRVAFRAGRSLIGEGVKQ